MGIKLKVTQYNTRYVVETPNGKLHVLNQKSFDWNMKHVFGLTPALIKELHRMLLHEVNQVIVELPSRKSA